MDRNYKKQKKNAQKQYKKYILKTKRATVKEYTLVFNFLFFDVWFWLKKEIFLSIEHFIYYLEIGETATI